MPTRKFRGIAVNTLGEAETFASAGFDEILITGRVVTKSKILRLCALCKSNDTSVALAVDNPRNVRDLAEAFEVARESLRVVVGYRLRLRKRRRGSRLGSSGTCPIRGSHLPKREMGGTQGPHVP